MILLIILVEKQGYYTILLYFYTLP